MRHTSIANLQSAIALNNMGITLLENACYFQALETWMDTVSIIKDCIRNRSSERSGGPTRVVDGRVRDSYKEMFHNALRRLTFPKPDSKNVPMVEVVKSNEYANRFIENSPSCTIIYPIQIQEADFSSRGVIEFHLAVVMHNIALAKISLYHVSNERNQNMMRAAIKPLRLAYSVSTALSKEPGTNFPEYLQLTAVIASGLVRALNISDNQVEASLFCKKLKQMKDVLKDLQSVTILTEGGNSIAPAA